MFRTCFLLAFLSIFAAPVNAVPGAAPLSFADDEATGTSTSGVAIVEVITEPDIGSDTLRFVGTPGGLLSLQLGQADRLVAGNLPPGSYTSTLSTIGPVLVAQGYSLESIMCDDQTSAEPSTGDVSTKSANFNVEDGETVTCQFKLTASDCLCPRAGSWTASNLPGLMVCTGTANLTLPLLPSTQTGTLEVRDGCQTLFATDFAEDTADITMHRLPGCGYEGTAQGVPMVIRFTWDVHDEEFMTGNLYSEVIQQGTTCVMTREIEMRFNN